MFSSNHVNNLICLPPGFHTITICNEELNGQHIRIVSVCGVIVAPEITTRQECATPVSASGAQNGTYTWRDITGGGNYTSFLSCTTGCNSDIIITPGSNSPASLRYEVCGTVAGNSCTVGGRVCDTILVNVLPNVEIAIDPASTAFCTNDIKENYRNRDSNWRTYTIEWRDNLGTVIGTGSTFPPGSAGNYSVYAIDNSTTVPCSEALLSFVVTSVNCIQLAQLKLTV